MPSTTTALMFAGVIVAGATIGLSLPTTPALGSRAAETFGFCHIGGGANCVVDGDTAWIDGEKVRVADTDAPETHPPRCEREDELGRRATQRLAELMNAGLTGERSFGQVLSPSSAISMTMAAPISGFWCVPAAR